MRWAIGKGLPLAGGGDTDGLVEIQVAKLGHYVHPVFGEGEITSAHVAQIVANFGRDANPLAIDYEHQTFADPPVPAPAAGWIHELIDKGGAGLWAMVKWTDRAREAIGAKEYAFISPVIFFDASDRETGAPIGAYLAPPALTNMPFFDGMAPVMMRNFGKGAEDMDWKQILATLGIVLKEGQEPTEEVALGAIKARLDKPAVVSHAVLARLGLPQGATEDQALAAVARLEEQGHTVEKVPTYIYEVLGLDASAKPAEVKAELLLLKTPGDTVSGAEHRALQAKAAVQEREALIAKALADGKITPAEKDHWLTEAEKDLDAVKIVIAKRPQVVPVGQQSPPPAPEKSAAAVEGVQAAINKQLGVSDELFAKYTQAQQ